MANDGAALRANETEPTVTWIGHATLLIQLAGVNILTDPQWSERASPLSFAGPKRVTPPGVRFEDLPPIHVVLISHDHYDHLDEATVRRLAEVHHPRFYVPLGFRDWFAELGITDVVELDWWDSRPERGLTLTLVPVQHWTARSCFEMNRRLWGGWVVAGGDRRLFFAGDTGYYAPYFKEIGARLGPFDLAAISIGAYCRRPSCASRTRRRRRRCRSSPTSAGAGSSPCTGGRSTSPRSRWPSRRRGSRRRLAVWVWTPTPSGSSSRVRRAPGSPGRPAHSTSSSSPLR